MPTNPLAATARELLVMGDKDGALRVGVDGQLIVCRITEVHVDSGEAFMPSGGDDSTDAGIDVVVEHEPHALARTASTSSGASAGKASSTSAVGTPRSR